MTPEVVVADGDELGEGPQWDSATGELVRIDITRGRVHHLDPVSGRTSTVELGDVIGFAIPRAAGGLVVGLRRAVVLLEPDGSSSRILAAVGVKNGSMTVGDLVMVNSLLIQLFIAYFGLGLFGRMGSAARTKASHSRLATATPRKIVRPRATAALRPSLRRAAKTAQCMAKPDMATVMDTRVGMYVPTCTPVSTISGWCWASAAASSIDASRRLPEQLCAIALWNRPRAAGQASMALTFAPPPDWPKIVTLPGSPPNAAMLSRTQANAATMSSTPALPDWPKRSSLSSRTLPSCLSSVALPPVMTCRATRPPEN